MLCLLYDSFFNMFFVSTCIRTACSWLMCGVWGTLFCVGFFRNGILKPFTSSTISGSFVSISNTSKKWFNLPASSKLGTILGENKHFTHGWILHCFLNIWCDIIQINGDLLSSDLCASSLTFTTLTNGLTHSHSSIGFFQMWLFRSFVLGSTSPPFSFFRDSLWRSSVPTSPWSLFDPMREKLLVSFSEWSCFLCPSSVVSVGLLSVIDE